MDQEDNRQHTLQLGLILPLIVGKQFVVRRASARHSSFGTHTMALASQASGTLSTVGQFDTALLFDIDRGFRSGQLCFALILLLLFLAVSTAFIFCFSLLSSRTLTCRCFPSSCTITSDDVLCFRSFGIVPSTVGSCGSISCIFCFLLLALLLLLFGKAVFNM